MFATRLDRARARMEADGVDVLMLSAGSDLPYFCGYEAMPLERITMLVVPREGDATLVIPGLERARVQQVLRHRVPHEPRAHRAPHLVRLQVSPLRR